jgi:hypothetical protein
MSAPLINRVLLAALLLVMQFAHTADRSTWNIEEGANQTEMATLITHYFGLSERITNNQGCQKR